MGYKTPNIDRIANEGMIFTDYLRRAELHGGTGVVHHRPVRPAHRPHQGRPARRGAGPEGRGHHHRRGAEAARLSHRSVRQEPPRRPRRAPADDARLRRVLRQPVPPERRGGTRGRRLPEREGLPRASRRSSGRAACCTAGPTARAARRSRTPVRSPRSGWRRCDDEFLAAAKKFIKAAHDAGEPFFVWFNTSHMHAWTHVKPESRGQSGRWQSEYHDVMIDHDKHIGEMLDFLDELGIADNTFVHVQHRQRAAHEHLAGCGHDAVPLREEHELGRRLPRAVHGPLPGRDPGRIGLATRSSATWTGSRPSSRSPASRTSTRS